MLENYRDKTRIYNLQKRKGRNWTQKCPWNQTLLSHNFKLYFCQLIPPKKWEIAKSLQKNHITLSTWSQSPCHTSAEGEEEDQGDARGQWETGTRTSYSETTLHLTKPITFIVLLWCPQDSPVGTVEMPTNLSHCSKRGGSCWRSHSQQVTGPAGEPRVMSGPSIIHGPESTKNPRIFPKDAHASLYEKGGRRRWSYGCFDPFLPELYFPDFTAWGQRKRSHFFTLLSQWRCTEPGTILSASRTLSRFYSSNRGLWGRNSY